MNSIKNVLNLKFFVVVGYLIETFDCYLFASVATAEQIANTRNN